MILKQWSLRRRKNIWKLQIEVLNVKKGIGPHAERKNKGREQNQQTKTQNYLNNKPFLNFVT